MHLMSFPIIGAFVPSIIGALFPKAFRVRIEIRSRTFVNKHRDVTAMTMDVPLMLHKEPSIQYVCTKLTVLYPLPSPVRRF